MPAMPVGEPASSCGRARRAGGRARNRGLRARSCRHAAISRSPVRPRDARASTIAPGAARIRAARPARNARCGRARCRRTSRPASRRRSADQRIETRAPTRGAGGAKRARRARVRSGIGSCGMRAAGVPARAENGKHVQEARGRSPRPAPGSREHRLALGREAGDQIGAERRSPAGARGRACRTRRHRAREWRRFMRFRIRSSPACSERCRCGISRGSSAISRQQLVVDLGRSRSRKAAGASAPAPASGAGAPSGRALGLPGRSPPLGGEIDAGQHDLAVRRPRPARAPRATISPTAALRLLPRP